MSTSPLKTSTAAERVVANSGAVELPLLTKTNYHEWSLVMQVSLEALGLWEAVETDKVERREDRLALAAILRGVPSEMKAGLAVKTSAKEAWAAVRKARMGDKRVKEANAQRLLKEFENVKAIDGETIEDLATRIDGLAGKLRELGEEMEDKRVVRKILRVVPKRYNQIACAIEMFSDLDTTTVEELVGQLRAAEDRYIDDEVAAAGAGVERLLLTEEQWETRRRQHGKEHARRCGGDKSGGRGGGDERDDDSSSTSSGRGGSRFRGRCFECGERGHMARDCTEKKKKKKERAFFGEADVDDEPTLL